MTSPAPDPASPWIVPGLLALVVLRWVVELILDRLNERHTLAHAAIRPSGFQEVMDDETHAKTVRYTVAKTRFQQLESTFNSALLVTLLLTGLLPAAYHTGTLALGNSPAALAFVVLTIPLLLSLTHLPFDWARQFKLEAAFGFNTSTFETWCLDHLKSTLLTCFIGFPLLWLLLSLPALFGSAWWLYACLAWLGLQLTLTYIVPALILPWFNHFTPLPEGTLRQRLHHLADRTSFPHREILVMDGSRRSRHSNAFFTGLGRYRRIVLYDTLISQLDDTEIEAVLAHEIGHYRLGHVPRLLAASAMASFLLFFLFAQLAKQPGLFAALGFRSSGIAPLLLTAVVFGGPISFWLAPLANAWCRRFEYQADRFSAQSLGGHRPLVHALRKLSQCNLTNLTPHPLYSRFYYSHPTLWERERALDSRHLLLNAAERSDTTTGK